MGLVFADKTGEECAAKGNTHFTNAFFAILLAPCDLIFIYLRNKFIVAKRMNRVHMLLY
jgi:hypothetical protein